MPTTSSIKKANLVDMLKPKEPSKTVSEAVNTVTVNVITALQTGLLGAHSLRDIKKRK